MSTNSTGSYRQVAVLTRLQVTLPRRSAKSDAATAAAEAAFDAHAAGEYRKKLYPSQIKPIEQTVASARAYLASQTRPYMGARMLPNRRIMSYLDTMGKFQLAFEQAVTVFMQNIATVMTQAQ